MNLHPQKKDLTLVVTPLSKEHSSYQNTHLLMGSELLAFCEKMSTSFDITIDTTLIKEAGELWAYSCLPDTPANKKIMDTATAVWDEVKPDIEQFHNNFYPKFKALCFEKMPGRNESYLELWNRSKALSAHLREVIEARGVSTEDKRVLLVGHSQMVLALREKEGVDPETGKFINMRKMKSAYGE